MSTIDKIIYGSQTLEVVDTEARSQIAGKADKEEGKTLSTNDLTNELKTNYDAAYAHISDTNNPHNITPEAIGAAKDNHNHDSVYIKNDILSKAISATMDGTDIVLTTDRYQYVDGLTGNSSQSTLVWFPSVDSESNFKEIHLYIFNSSIKSILFDTIISWKYNQITDNSFVPNPDYIYEFIFTYINTKWIGEMIVHANSYTPEKNVDLVNKKYVDDKVAGIVNSAPETLDTLQELATALGNDADFATTMTNSLANKADKDHTHAQYLTEHQDISGKVDKVEGKGLSTNDLTADLKTNYDTAYTHSQATHAPVNAQKNSDITKAEIEAKLIGDVTTHTHAQYLTEHQDLSEYAKTADIHTHSNKEVLDTITAEKIAQWDNNTGSGGSTSGISIVTISQSDYDALETKDSNTLYLITTTNAGEIDSASNDITLSDDLPAGTYTLKYEDENNQPLEGFDEITTMEVQ